jgi:hypothetical protein
LLDADILGFPVSQFSLRLPMFGLTRPDAVSFLHDLVSHPTKHVGDRLLGQCIFFT